MHIYLFINKVNGKKYVGQSVKDPDVRFRNHRYVTQSKGSPKYAIHKAIIKYGWENFSRHVLETCSTPEELNAAEIFWIAHYNCMAPDGYNLTAGGDAPGMVSEETRRKMSEAQRGKKQSEECNAKKSAALKGRRLSPEQVERARAYRHTNESRAKMSEAHRGFKHSEESKAKMSMARKGVKKPEGHGEKVAAALRGKPRPPEVLAKLREGNRLYHERRKREKEFDKLGELLS